MGQAKKFITMSEFIQSQAGALKNKREELRERGCPKYYLQCNKANVIVILRCNEANIFQKNKYYY